MLTKKNGEWLEIQIPEEWNGYTIEYILKNTWQVPKGLLHQLRMEKGVRINGEIQPFSYVLSANQILGVHIFPDEEFGVNISEIEVAVIYEDDHILIVNKPAGIDVHPNELNQSNTLANGIANYYMKKGIKTKVRHIHRLDKDTTGAVIFAKNALSGAMMDRLLENRMIKRTYLALVQGKMKRLKGTIDEPIGKDRHHPTRRRVSETGQKAVTNYEVLDFDSTQNMTLLKLQLQTGRTHQIRVHMSFIGHPIVGDQLYGGQLHTTYTRQALHAAKISFRHPITEQHLTLIAPFIDNPPIFKYNLTKLMENPPQMI